MKLKLKLASTAPPSAPYQKQQSNSETIYEKATAPSRVEVAIRQHDVEYPPPETPIHQWFDVNERLPPNLNEDIMIFYTERRYHELARSFVLLQNVLYRRETNTPMDHFYWMRFRGFHDSNRYPE
jgi:hypothetical protein